MSFRLAPHALPVLLGVLLSPLTADASCVFRNCICHPAHRLLDARVVSSDGVRTVFEVQAVHTRPGSLPGVGPVLEQGRMELGAEPQEAPGSRWLLYWLSWEHPVDAGTVSGADVVHRVPIEPVGDGEVVCRETSPDFRLPVSVAVETALSEDCRERTVELGYPQPPCNDTRMGGCSVPPASAAASAYLPLGAVGLWLGARLLRQRRRSG